MTLLRHTPTGDLYPYNDSLARRDDMVAYTPPPEGAKEEPVAAVKAAKRVESKPKDELPNLDDL